MTDCFIWKLVGGGEGKGTGTVLCPNIVRDIRFSIHKADGVACSRKKTEMGRPGLFYGAWEFGVPVETSCMLFDKQASRFTTGNTGIPLVLHRHFKGFDACFQCIHPVRGAALRLQHLFPSVTKPTIKIDPTCFT